MLNALKRYEIQLLVAVGHTQAEVARFAGVDERTVRRVLRQPPVMTTASLVEEGRRTVGRPLQTMAPKPKRPHTGKTSRSTSRAKIEYGGCVEMKRS